MKKTLLFGIICSLLIAIVPLKAQAANEIISYIYHNHQGGSQSAGGCYEKPLYHIHKGNSVSGGECYKQAIYHQHKGAAEQGNGCYTVPVYHSHTGNATNGGACYLPRFHEHGNDCYTTEICHLRVESYGDMFDSWYQHCYHHGESVHGEWDAVWTHSACGQEKYPATTKMCLGCRLPDAGSHDYTWLSCTRENELIGYDLACGKNESTIVSYRTGCNRQAGAYIEGYRLTCEKNSESIEGYAMNCGKEEAVPVGYVKITNLTGTEAEEVELEASYDDQDTTGQAGKGLEISGNPFVWTADESGEEIGDGDRIIVTQNGSYKVTLQAENQNIKREGLSVTIQVSNVKAPPQEEDNDNAATENDDGNESTGSESNNDDAKTEIESDDKGTDTGGNDTSGSYSEENEDGGSDSGIWEWTNDAVKKAVPTPEAVKTTEAVAPKSTGKSVKKAVPTASPSPTPAMIKVETKEIKVPKLEAEPEAVEEEIVQIEEVVTETSFWQTPVAKALVITLSSALVLLGLFVLWLILFRYAGIYGDDGEGNECFLGFALIRRGDPFLLVIPEHILDRACTSRYCLRPGILFYMLHEQSELLVEAKNKKVSLVIEKEMKFKY